jgi:hypothetical protein
MLPVAMTIRTGGDAASRATPVISSAADGWELSRRIRPRTAATAIYDTTSQMASPALVVLPSACGGAR